jgi:hexosaminidase
VSSLILDSTYTAVGQQGPGVVDLRLVNVGRETFQEFRLAFTSIATLTPVAGEAVALVRRVGNYHELAAPEETVLGPGGVWEIGTFACAFPLAHANDGPVRAFLIRRDGTTVPIRAAPTARDEVRVAAEPPPRLSLSEPSDIAAAAWAVAAGCEARLHRHGATVLGPHDGEPVAASVDPALGAESFDIARAADAGWTVAAGSRIALQWALVELARRTRDGSLTTAMSGRPQHGRPARGTPKYGYRGLMIDVSRHVIPAADVLELIDLAAWRMLNVLHLHLTDDTGWRLPVAAYPALAEVAAWRGFGLPVPPQHGAGAEPYGGCYSAADIDGWVRRAAELGIELIPELDVPGHSFATIAAVPELRDPADTGAVESVQSFGRNVLNPGLPATWTFLEAVFGEAADRFPGSRIHIGGDEVVTGAWDASPAAQRWAQARGAATGHAAVERAFLAEIVAVAKRATGRTIGAWQEAAESGGLQPGDGYVIGWREHDAARTLAEAGYDVVASPAQAYYLDMAAGPEWEQPGMSWAGFVTRETVASFDPTAGWSDDATSRLLGVQAALWTEHVPDRATLRRLLLPRLDAFAEACWRS